MPKRKLLESIPLHVRKLNCRGNVYEVEYHVGEKALNMQLPPKLGLAKKSPFVGFPSCMLENIEVECVFPYALLPCHEGETQNTIVITKKQMPSFHVIGVSCQLIQWKMKCQLYIML